MMPTIDLRPLNPSEDLDLVFGWVSAPRATFWGMTDKPREEVGEIYGWLQEQEHLAAYVVSVDGAPVGMFQTYDPFVDEIGEFYDRQPGDLGVHLLLADEPARAGHTNDILQYLVRWCFAHGQVQRVVVEPDALNAASLLVFGRVGMVAGPKVEIPGKVAQFAFLDREAAKRVTGVVPVAG